MRASLTPLLAVLGALGALLLVLAAAGLLPAEEPAPPRVERFAVEKAIVRPSAGLAQPGEADAGAGAARALRVFPLCEAPAQGARWFKLALSEGQEALLVWCKQGYELFVASERAGELALTRTARFKARAELPGGAAAGDFDGDGQRDLVLGVASQKGVAHRSGAGVYWLRGRREGGFEPARILAEISSAAVAAYARGPGRPDELFVLTAGDVAAQRQGELWSFGREPSLSRKQVSSVGLDPRGLALRARGERLDAFVLSGQPGRLARVSFELGTLAPTGALETLELRYAQALAHEPSFEEALFARDATALYQVERGDTLRLTPFARDAHVGPFAVADLDADLKPDVFAASEAAVEWFAVGGRPRAELSLPGELALRDVETVRVGASQPTPVALVAGRPEASGLSLLVLPLPPWKLPAGAPGVSLASAPLSSGEAPAEVALE